MRTLKDNPSVGVFGNIWAEQTVRFIKSAMVCDCVNIFKYTNREELFIDQYDYFIITDFGTQVEWTVEYRDTLNQMREIIYTRSMKSVIIANNDDADVSSSLREACCRVVRLDGLRWNNIPEKCAESLLYEMYSRRSSVRIPATAA
jgi:hypothetical protein